METQKSLIMEFSKSDNGKYSITVDAPIEPANPDDIKAFANAVITSDCMYIDTDDKSVKLTALLSAEIQVKTVAQIELA